MKKYIALLLVVLMTVIGVCGCGSNDSSNDYATDTKIRRSEALEIAKQEMVNHFCLEENVRTLRIVYGTEDVFADGDGWKVHLKGYYYPVNDYGETENQERFAYTVHLDANGDVEATFEY